MKVTIDTDQLKKLTQEADKILFTAEGETTLVTLLDLEQQVKLAIDTAKQQIIESAKKIDKNFVSVQGEQVKVAYRSFGQKYAIDQSHIQDLPKNLYKTHIRYSADSKAIDEMAKTTGKLPIGIVEPERPRQLVIQRKK